MAQPVTESAIHREIMGTLIDIQRHEGIFTDGLNRARFDPMWPEHIRAYSDAAAVCQYTQKTLNGLKQHLHSVYLQRTQPPPPGLQLASSASSSAKSSHPHRMAAAGLPTGAFERDGCLPCTGPGGGEECPTWAWVAGRKHNLICKACSKKFYASDAPPPPPPVARPPRSKSPRTLVDAPPPRSPVARPPRSKSPRTFVREQLCGGQVPGAGPVKARRP